VTVLAEVAQNYFQLLGLDLQRTIAIQTVSDREKTVDFFRIRSEGGIGTDLDVSRGDADLVGARATFVSLERQIALAENTISLLLGRAPGPVARTAVTTLPEPPTVPAGLPSQLLERRADVREAEANLVAANAQVGVATANLFPKFSLTAVGGIISSNLNFVAAHNPDGLWSVGGQVDWLAPILQGASLRDQLHAAKSAYEAVRTAYVKAVMNAFKDVADALVSLARLREQAGETQKQVDALARAVDIAKTQFEGGTATYLDVINAEEQLFPAQLDLAQVKTQELTAFVQLYRVLGGGWWLAE